MNNDFVLNAISVMLLFVFIAILVQFMPVIEHASECIRIGGVMPLGGRC